MNEAQRSNLIRGLSPLETQGLLQELDEIYKQDPWLWLCEEVLTQDEATKRIRSWPREKDYLRDLVEILMTEQLVTIPKSRRMMVSWLLSALAVYEARYFPYSAIFIQSETEDKSAYLVDKRCAFIEDNLREPALRRKYKPIRTAKGAIGRLTYKDSGSYIWAIPQGGSVIRTYTFSRLFMDESDFQPEGHDALNAALSIVEEGKTSKIVLVTTSSGPGGVAAGICKETGFVRWAG